jgi:hypothetical protein
LDPRLRVVCGSTVPLHVAAAVRVGSFCDAQLCQILRHVTTRARAIILSHSRASLHPGGYPFNECTYSLSCSLAIGPVCCSSRSCAQLGQFLFSRCVTSEDQIQFVEEGAVEYLSTVATRWLQDLHDAGGKTDGRATAQGALDLKRHRRQYPSTSLQDSLTAAFFKSRLHQVCTKHAFVPSSSRWMPSYPPKQLIIMRFIC